MGRLFWKLFLAFWLTLLVAGSGVGLVIRWQAENAQARGEPSFIAPRSQFLLDSAAVALRHGGVEALRELLAERRGGRAVRLHVIDAAGLALFGGELSAAEIARARAQAASGDASLPARQVIAADGRTYLLFVSARARPPHARSLRPEPLPPWVPVGIGLLASLAFSALLAWYLARPVRHLRQALADLAEGRMQTRVGGSMGGRRDEIADLGDDFDRMAQRLQQLVDAQRRLLHDVSHELRSPLARLQAAVGLARQDPRKLESTLDRVEREAVRLDELVGGLLTLSRLDSGADARGAVQVDINELIAGIVADARFEARAAGRDVRFNASAEISVSGQVESLHRALENVIRNAVKFTAEGSEVTVALERTAHGDARISVADRGPGVRAAELAEMFEPFRRVGDADAPGFGLGLAIARRAVQAQGGAIEARNRADGGLLVEIVLPVSGARR